MKSFVLTEQSFGGNISNTHGIISGKDAEEAAKSIGCTITATTGNFYKLGGHSSNHEWFIEDVPEVTCRPTNMG